MRMRTKKGVMRTLPEILRYEVLELNYLYRVDPPSIDKFYEIGHGKLFLFSSIP
jgi:hypothetical protein